LNAGARPLAVYLLTSLLATSALASEDEAVDVSALAAWVGREVAEIRLSGMPEDLERRAIGGLALKPRRKLLRVTHPLLRTSLAQADGQRLRYLLARNGFPAARITGSGEPDDDRVIVTFTVETGLMVSYGEVMIRDLPDAAQASVDTVRARLPRGGRFSDRAVQTARSELELAMRRAGHARPELDLELQRVNEQTVDVSFVCRPGRVFRYRDFDQEGAPEDLRPLVDQIVDLEPGTPYKPAVAKEARRDLRELQLFRQVRLTSEEDSDTTLTLRAELRPRDMITAMASVGSFTDDALVASAGIRHRNLLRRGRGGEIGARYSLHGAEARAGLWWPGLVSRRSRSEIRLTGTIEDEDAYRLEKVELELATLFRIGSYSSLRVFTSVSQGDLENRSADEDEFLSDVGLLTVLGATYYRDTSDNPIDPQVGSRLTVRTGLSPPGAWTDTPFVGVHMYTSRYLPLGGRRVLALRMDGGVSRPLGDALDLRPDFRFFAGGVSTMRGYGRRDLGPVDSEGQPVGGEVRLLASAELRQPLTGIFGTALFVDSGQVWRKRDEFDPGELAVAAGAGLLLYTPVGPVRLDLAYNLTQPERDQSRTHLSFAIGHPF
jgi:outer membrane translocation and assembly module TamA